MKNWLIPHKWFYVVYWIKVFCGVKKQLPFRFHRFHWWTECCAWSTKVSRALNMITKPNSLHRPIACTFDFGQCFYCSRNVFFSFAYYLCNCRAVIGLCSWCDFVYCFFMNTFSVWMMKKMVRLEVLILMDVCFLFDLGCGMLMWDT